MFRCGSCHEVSAPGETAITVALATRPRTYHNVLGDGRVGKITTGHETVRETLMHADCAELATLGAEKEVAP